MPPTDPGPDPDAAPERVRELATWRIARLHRRSHARLTAGFAEHGLTGRQYRLLAALVEAGAASQVELGERTGLDRSDVAGGVDALVARGEATRSPDPADRRRNVVTPTSAGASALIALDAVVASVQDDVLAPLSAGERAVFERLLDRLLEGVPRDPRDSRD
ncbi:MarR family winged helix-turn-helix transcriptional regulator [Agromyces binzhouensis]|uniref:MarR family winged helix-turn-helix transcriptional regulator n=1 Tax=Agromyces binzhouensis TaxID=1817495 RepID=UPI00363E8A70